MYKEATRANTVTRKAHQQQKQQKRRIHKAEANERKAIITRRKTSEYHRGKEKINGKYTHKSRKQNDACLLHCRIIVINDHCGEKDRQTPGVKVCRSSERHHRVLYLKAVQRKKMTRMNESETQDSGWRMR